MMITVGRARNWEASDWFDDESFQLDGSGPLGEGKVLHYGLINRLKHAIYVRYELISEGGE